MSLLFDPFSKQGLEKFNFSEHPFLNAPDNRFLYLTKQRQKILEHIIDFMGNREGLLVIEGENGSGKTTLASRIEYIFRMNSNHKTIYMALTPFIDKVSFWKFLVSHCYLPIRERPNNNQNSFYKFINESYENFYFDLIVDKAEDMNPEIVETLLEIDSWTRKQERMVQILVFGTSRMSIHRRSLLTKKEYLKPLNYEDVFKLIEYRLFVSGSPQLFSNEAVMQIYRLSNGVPSKVVHWCRVSLEKIAERGKPFVDARDIEEIMEGMGVPPRNRANGLYDDSKDDEA